MCHVCNVVRFYREKKTYLNAIKSTLRSLKNHAHKPKSKDFNFLYLKRKKRRLIMKNLLLFIIIFAHVKL